MPRAAALMFACCASVPAAEEALREVRLLVGAGSLSYDAQGQARATDGSAAVERFSTTGDADERLQVTLQGIASMAPVAGRGAPVLGLEVGWRRSSSDVSLDGYPSDLQFDHEGWGVDVLVGWAWAVAPRIHVELTPFAGLGIQETDFEFRSAATGMRFTGDDSGTVREYGLRAAGAWQVSDRIDVVIEARWLREEFAEHLVLVDAGAVALVADLDTERSGIVLQVGAGYRF